MNLSDYIRQVGVCEFARRFNVTERAATAWKYGARTPRVETAKLIVENSPVTWAGIAGQENSNARQGAA